MKKMLVLLLSGVFLSCISAIFAQVHAEYADRYLEIQKLYFLDDDLDAALAKANEAIGYYPDELKYYSLRGQIYADMNNFEAALGDFNKVIQATPRDDNAYFWRASVHYDMRNLESSYVDVSRCVQINPNNSSCYTLRAMVRRDLGDFVGFSEDMERAQKAIHNSIEPQNSLSN